ncbi:SPFH/Band 7/PHB domain protein [bacterium]|nr:SPFH/Band 7/PHB domain protein [bacterium]
MIYTVLLVLVVMFVLKSVIIVKQAEEIIIERWGKFHRILKPGLNFIFPFIDTTRGISWKVNQKDISGHTYSYYKMVDRIDMRENVYDFSRQNVITKDNATISINALLYFQIIDAKSAVYAIGNLVEAIEKLTQTTLRNLVGQLVLDETLVSRDKINHELRAILDEATNKWGVKVNRVELQDIIPPADIQQAMEKQMKAEREKRATILNAEAEKEAAINIAEGKKQAAILEADGHKQAMILRADGQKQSRILEANGEQEAIKLIIDAIAGNGKPDQYLIAMKYIETLKAMADGKDSKVVYMPYEATGILSSVDGIKQMFDRK